MDRIIILFARILYYYQLALIFYVLTSWFPSVRASKVGRILGSVVEPYLMIFKKIIPPLGMVDFSPLIALWVLNMASVGLGRLL